MKQTQHVYGVEPSAPGETNTKPAFPTATDKRNVNSDYKPQGTGAKPVHRVQQGLHNLVKHVRHCNNMDNTILITLME